MTAEKHSAVFAECFFSAEDLIIDMFYRIQYTDICINLIILSRY